VARILVTGAGGFIGRALCPGLAVRGHQVIAGCRRDPPPDHPNVAGVKPVRLGEVMPGRDWSSALRDIDVVIHLAQRAHSRATDAMLAQERLATADLARSATRAGARRLIYFSSIKAMGDSTLPGRPFRAGDPPQPEDAYGRAKLATERALAEAAAATPLEIVILRPPLVYGAGVGANFRALARLAASGLPLPFGGIDNCRSLVCLDNLVDLVGEAATHPAAAGRILLAADGTDLSTPDLIRILAEGQGRAAHLFALPASILATLRRLPAVGPAVARLTQSLQIDNAAERILLDWQPPVSPAGALFETARAIATP
jgi:UDP-glucose 4-epimerase